MNNFFAQMLLVAGAATSLLVHDCRAEDWARFRGPNGSGIVAECNVPLPWQPSDVAWTTPLRGTGNGSPVVFGDKAFVLSAEPKTATRYLQAFNLVTGKELWHTKYSGQPHRFHQRSSYASCTPAVNADAVFITWGDPENLLLVAVDHAGTELWRKDLGRFVSQHGFGASPTVFENRVILFNSQAAQQLDPGVTPGTSCVIAFDAANGKEIWSTPRTTTRACYGVPTRFTDPNSGADALLFANTGDGIFALELATGKPLWNRKVFTKRCVASPIIVGDLAYASEGSGGGGNMLHAVDTRSPDHPVVFSVNRASYVPCAIAKDDLLFLWHDKGLVSCIDTATGKSHWQNRVSNPPVSSSPVVAGDKLIGINEQGTVTILAASKEFHKIAEIDLGQRTRATPAVHRDYLLFRTDSKLIRIGK